jgi:hypothetical protein
MKKFITFFFFVPLFAYILVALLNPTILFGTSDINILWFFGAKQVPVLAYTVFFFACYIIAIWLLLKFSDIFSDMQRHKLENEVNRLKASIQDGKWNTNTNAKDNLLEILEKFQAENKQMLDSIKKENEKTTSRLFDEIKNLKK